MNNDITAIHFFEEEEGESQTKAPYEISRGFRTLLYKNGALYLDSEKD